jgi:hypothetical protein
MDEKDNPEKYSTGDENQANSCHRYALVGDQSNSLVDVFGKVL